VIRDDIYWQVDECYHKSQLGRMGVSSYRLISGQQLSAFRRFDAIDSLYGVQGACPMNKRAEKKISALKVKLAEAENQSREGKTRPFREAMAAIKNKIVRGSLSSEKHCKH